MIEFLWQLLSSFWDFVGILLLIMIVIAALFYGSLFFYSLFDLWRVATRWERSHREADDD